MDGIRVLLDTNAIIAQQRGNQALHDLLMTVQDVFVPSVAVGELYYGAYRSQRPEDNIRHIAAFIAERVILTVDVHTANIYGYLKHLLRVKGRPIPENDLWIAALATQHHLVLLTDDAHFAEIDGLRWRRW